MCIYAANVPLMCCLRVGLALFKKAGKYISATVPKPCKEPL